MTMMTRRCIRIQWMYQMFVMIYHEIGRCIRGHEKNNNNDDKYYDQDGFLITEDYVDK